MSKRPRRHPQRTFPKSDKYSLTDLERAHNYKFEWSHPPNVVDGTGVLGMYRLAPTPPQRIQYGAIARITLDGIYVVRAVQDQRTWLQVFPVLMMAIRRHLKAFGITRPLPLLVQMGTVIEADTAVSAAPSAMPMLALEL
jgi:hypothetical protein